MPLALVHGDGVELVKYLVSRGLMVGASRTHHDKLKNYINLSEPQETIICTDKIGWHGDVFVFPDETIGSYENEIVYQPEYPANHKFGVSGTLKEWQENISKYCIDNSRLAFGVSLAFASALLPIAEMQSGGFHFRDTTSSGKTTAAKISGSVWGGSNDELGYCQSWKATANGLESVAEMHNHSLLCLDELAQIDGRQAGDVAYMLANGEGKKRMTKSVTARRSLSWQLLFLSTGEISLADKMSEAGLTIKGGQEIRILDIPSDTGKFGVFESLHEFSDGQSFADHLRSASRKYYGTAIREFLSRFIEIEKKTVIAGWNDFQTKFVAKILPNTKKYPSEVYRAATRFALVAFAGETATKLNITKWEQGEASKAAEIIFRAWFDNRIGRGGSDAERAISQIRAFIEAHGSSRFEMLTETDQPLDTSKIINRAGFRKQNDSGELEYLFLSETFRKEVCKGFDCKFVCKILDERGLLSTDSVGYQKQLKYAGTKIRAYWISPKILSCSDESIETEKALTAIKGK
jgi:putative DNA primase/helicase